MKFLSSRPLRIAALLCGLAIGVLSVAVAAMVPNSSPSQALAKQATLGAAGDAAFATLVRTWYREPGRWRGCVPGDCEDVVRDWGADSLTYALFLRWKIAHDRAILPMMTALSATLPTYQACRGPACTAWSDVPLWDAIAAAREYEVTRAPAALRKARRAFALVDDSDAFALGACPAVNFQRPQGHPNALKTLETDSNYVKAALLLYRWTGERPYLERAVRKYAAIRRYFLDPARPLYTVYLFDDARTCRQVPGRFYASVNGNMIYNGITLAALTGRREYLTHAIATARTVASALNDAAGFYAGLQADNDIAEPLIEAMYDLATEHHIAFARSWLITNAAVARPTADGSYGRFFAGPAPSGPISIWSANGGLALAIASGGVARDDSADDLPLWHAARYVSRQVRGAPARIAFTGRAVALIGTIGAICCEPGHVRVFIDGNETVDTTGIWQNKSPASRSLANSVLLSWRWPKTGRHTIDLKPATANAKEGGSYVNLTGYEFVP